MSELLLIQPFVVPPERESRTTQLHRLAALALGLRHPLLVEFGNVPRRYLAVTSRTTDGACRIVYRRRDVSIRVVAHELCHCSLHHDVLSPTGWDPYVVGEREIRLFERQADACGRALEKRLR